MVNQTIQTSAWASNCGMHALADYFVEKILKSEFQKIFTGAPYNKLLFEFRKIYQRDDIFWLTFKKISTHYTREDLQIIWGYALRRLIGPVLQNNQTYKQNLFFQFEAAVEVFKNGNLEELNATYPTIFLANSAYFNSPELPTHNQQAMIDFWNNTGFNNHCAALSNLNEKTQNFEWLSADELTIFCQYFNIECVVIEHTKNTKHDPNKLYLSNSTNTHWERVVNIKNQKSTLHGIQKTGFQNALQKEGIRIFTTYGRKTGELIFLEKLLDEKLWLDFIYLPEEPILERCLLNNKPALFSEHINHNFNQSILNDYLEFSVGYFDDDKLLDWLYIIELELTAPVLKEKILLASVKYQKHELFDKYRKLHNLNETSVLLPSLQLAIKNNYTETVLKILNSPEFIPQNNTPYTPPHVERLLIH